MSITLFRVIAAGATAAATYMLTNTYYVQTIESLKRIVTVVDFAIPAVLAVALLLHVIQHIRYEKPEQKP